ncbi:bifunctional tetrahydrofolate synthase/dihydrofolate synthase [Legionella saoudiensis]|uniref:bifunctional tetrahydrofolate synthase/dihydrofolate synthase n=1 Tax=Legionella saoudiensis TaxID=1750561 RepID=UPI000B0F1310|nr:bifunctional tetrahydrofolate synthase/dihydrofolate synthase [Legionella saoudiensis]
MLKPYNEWSLAEWLSDLEARNINEIQLGLSRIQMVAERLQLLKPNCKVITVAGTNGKGSTVTALEHIYHTANYKVGTYTSPHLIQFNERIRIGLTYIADDTLCQAFTLIESARDNTVLTYFEFITLAALWYFQKEQVDIIILEVGLGGRLDATNIIDADLSIITTIDLDHQDFLGDTLEAIGYEKAGILRSGKPFIYADENPPLSIVKVATTLPTISYYLGREFSFEEGAQTWSVQCGETKINDLPKPSIQLKSAAAAITASILLAPSLPISYEHIQKAMERIFIPGRLQLQKGTIDILYDVSHNPQSARLLAKTLQQYGKTAKVHAVFSALKDKDILGLILPLKDLVDYWYPAQLDVKRAISANLLLSYFKDAEIFVKICYNEPLLAFKTALDQAQPGDLIVVYGSFFTVGHIMAIQPN